LQLQIQEVVVIVIPPSFSSTDHDFLFLLLFALIFGNCVQEFLELFLVDLLPQLARLRQGDEPVLDVGGTRFLDETYPAQAIRGRRVKNLVEDGCSSFGWDGSLVSSCTS
jgi:hypothetical protein